MKLVGIIGGGFGGGPFALQDNSGANVNLAYRINGEPVPEPASMIALTIGAVALIRRRRNS